MEGLNYELNFITKILIIISLILGILISIITIIYLHIIPTIMWLIIVFIILFSIILFVIYNRIKEIKLERELRRYTVTGYLVTKNELKNIGYLRYAGVLWKVQILSSHFHIQIPPLCPKCKIPIEELPKFLGGYLWNCTKCGYQKKFQYSFYQEVEWVKEYAKNEYKFKGEKAFSHYDKDKSDEINNFKKALIGHSLDFSLNLV